MDPMWHVVRKRTRGWSSWPFFVRVRSRGAGRCVREIAGAPGPVCRTNRGETAAEVAADAAYRPPVHWAGGGGGGAGAFFLDFFPMAGGGET